MTPLHLTAIVVASLGFAGQMGDAISTQVALSRGAVEGNPALKGESRLKLFLQKLAYGCLPLVVAILMGEFVGVDMAVTGVGVCAAYFGYEQTVKNIKFLGGL